MFEFASNVVRSLVGTKSKRRGRNRKAREYKRRLTTETLEPRHLLTQTLGVLVNEPDAFESYTLYAPSTSTNTYLIDMNGQVVNQWASRFTPMSTYLLEDGDLIRAGNFTSVKPATLQAAGISGRIERFSWDGKLEWKYTLHGPNRQIHHDFEVMPNGNILMIAWERRTKAAALRAGRDPALMPGGESTPPDSNYIWPDMIIEVQPNQNGFGGKVVWEWRLWDHLVQDKYANRKNYYGPNGVAEHPELVDINFESGAGGEEDPGAAGTPQDWTHFNGVDYNEELDQISISVRDFSEFWIIDHDMDYDQYGLDGIKQRSASDLLYRWGNPRTYKSGTPADQQQWYQHHAQFLNSDLAQQSGDAYVPIGDGDVHITVFDNGFGQPANAPQSVPDHSAGIEVVIPKKADGSYDIGNEPAPIWSYTAPNEPDFFSPIISSTQRLPNGNTFMDEGTEGRLFEVKPDGTIVWDFVNPEWRGQSGVVRGHATDKPPGIPFVGAQANLVFRSLKYSTDYPGLAGKDLTPGNFIEINPGDSVGLYKPVADDWYLVNRFDGTITDMITFDAPGVPAGWRAIAGDWDGDGVDTPGLYDPFNNVWYLNNKTDGSTSELTIVNAPDSPANWKPLAGDWDGDGVDTIGLYDPTGKMWYLNNKTDGSTTDVISFKGPKVGKNWVPITGDWDGDGTDTWGLYKKGTNFWHLNNKTDGSLTDRIRVELPSVPRGYQPVTGDWNSDGFDTIGHYDNRTNTWILNNRTDGTRRDVYPFTFPTPHPTWQPITGNWDGSTSIITAPAAPPLRLDTSGLSELAAAAALSEDQLAPVFVTGVQQVVGVEGIGAAIALRNVSFEIVDLPGTQLGRAVGDSLIQIDVDAAGAGWSFGDSEDGGADLLTAVMHELGHVLGYGHAEDGVMRSSLAVGAKRLWGAPGGRAAVDAAFS
jgi:hypothetical protein